MVNSKVANINIRTDEQVKIEADELFNKLGLNMSTAINIFLIKSINEQGIPFDVKLETPNEKTKLALDEGEKIARDKNYKTYKNTKELKKAINSWD